MTRPFLYNSLCPVRLRRAMRQQQCVLSPLYLSPFFSADASFVDDRRNRLLKVYLNPGTSAASSNFPSRSLVAPW